MSTYNWLDLQTLGSQPVMPKNLPDHWWRLGLIWVWSLWFPLGHVIRFSPWWLYSSYRLQLNVFNLYPTKNKNKNKQIIIFIGVYLYIVFINIVKNHVVMEWSYTSSPPRLFPLLNQNNNYILSIYIYSFLEPHQTAYHSYLGLWLRRYPAIYLPTLYLSRVTINNKHQKDRCCNLIGLVIGVLKM